MQVRGSKPERRTTEPSREGSVGALSAIGARVCVTGARGKSEPTQSDLATRVAVRRCGRRTVSKCVMRSSPALGKHGEAARVATEAAIMMVCGRAEADLFRRWLRWENEKTLILPEAAATGG